MIQAVCREKEVETIVATDAALVAALHFPTLVEIHGVFDGHESLENVPAIPEIFRVKAVVGIFRVDEVITDDILILEAMDLFPWKSKAKLLKAFLCCLYP